MNVDASNEKREKLNSCADRLENIKWRLNLYKNDLNANWDSIEMLEINNCIDAILNRIQRDINSLHSIDSDISSAIDEYLEEEEEEEEIIIDTNTNY
ncbi:MAG: hypothetical protein Q4F06_06380 [Eubacteriales bacterium]|nr:hypothetical protein [Eubacteriales bacterium]